MTKFILIKYPQSILDRLPPDSVFPSDEQLGLTDQGKSTAQRVGETLISQLRGSFLVWSGPAKRSHEGAEIIARIVGKRARVDARLDERRMFEPRAPITVREFRNRQERGYLNPSTLAAGEEESPMVHRSRVEGWLAEILAGAKTEDINIVVSHGAVIEHLHSALSSKPPEAMSSTFAFCAPAHAHVWSAVELPDKRRIWCCLGANINLLESVSFGMPFRGLEDLNGLAVDLASDPRFQALAEVTAGGPPRPLATAYYIR